MGSITDTLTFYLILMNLNSEGHMYLMATILDSAFAQALSPDPQASALFNT